MQTRNYLLFFFIVSLSLSRIMAQQCDSISKNVENLGIYGGHADDLAFSKSGRLFSAMPTASSVFISDDTAKTWYQAFSVDSLEFACGTRGWGGRGEKIFTNSKKWVAACTIEASGNLSAAVISYSNGDTNTWHTAVDEYLMDQLGYSVSTVKGIYLTDYFLYVHTKSGYIIRVDSTSVDTASIISIGSIAGIDTATYKITSIAVANSASGYPFYVVIDSSENIYGQIYKYDGVTFSKIYLASGSRVKTVFTHSGQTTGDTLFVDGYKSNGNHKFFRSLDGGLNWADISLNPSSTPNLMNATYSDDWVSELPQSKGLILSTESSGYSSFDLGNTWVQSTALTSSGNGSTAIAFATSDTSIVIGSSTSGSYVSINGRLGNFKKTICDGLASIAIFDIERNKNKTMFYLATEAGLAYTTKYNDTTIVGQAKWNAPYGEFPITGTDLFGGIQAVAIDPEDSLHVVAAYQKGLCVTHTGNGGFTSVQPTSYYGGRSKDVKFVTPSILLVVTGGNDSENSVANFGEIWRSADGGDSWNIVSPTNFGGGNTIAVGYGKDTVIYIGTGLENTEKGELYKSTDWGITWTKINDGPHDQFNASVTGLTINEIDIDARGTDTLYMVAGEDSNCAFVRSYDGGLSYQYIDANVAVDDRVNFFSVEMDQNKPDSFVYVANGKYLYLYSPILDTITTLYSGFPGDIIRDIALGSILVGSTTGFYTFHPAYEDIVTAIPYTNNNDNILLNIYPNPITQGASIRVEGFTSHFPIKITLFDLMGRNIQNVFDTVYGNGDIINFDASNLSNGIYYLQINTFQSTITKKIIIAKM